MNMPSSERPRARQAGIVIGHKDTGPENAITDVPGVRVGHVTLIQGDGPLKIGEGPIRTGVTAILPPSENSYSENWYDQPVEAGLFTFNGAGTTAGTTLIQEFARIETPILLTNTLSVGTVYEGVVRYMVEHIFRDRGNVPWFNPVVGETSDAFLNDIGGLHVRPQHVIEAITNARQGAVEEGAVGAGTGTGALGFKGGIGTASRIVEMGGETATIGVLVQSNFGGRLTIKGLAMDALDTPPQPPPSSGNSIMIIVATDLPLCGRLLDRVCKRATFGLARTGSNGGHGSGDYVIAFSTSYRTPDAKPGVRQALAQNEGVIDEAFIAVADATEEAILNSIFKAERMLGRDGHVRQALPIERVLEILADHGLAD